MLLWSEQQIYWVNNCFFPFRAFGLHGNFSHIWLWIKRMKNKNKKNGRDDPGNAFQDALNKQWNYEKQTGLVGGVLSKVISCEREAFHGTSILNPVTQPTPSTLHHPWHTLPPQNYFLWRKFTRTHNTVLLPLKYELKERNQIVFCFFQRRSITFLTTFTQN